MNFRYFPVFLLIFLLSLGNNVASQNSDPVKISLLTCDPGAEIYSIFGHTAIRVRDLDNQYDVVFNYGTFDFNTPNFLIKFGRGDLLYILSQSGINSFVNAYRRDNRTVYEQELNLDPKTKKKIVDFLFFNARPENRSYQYNSFSNNCATKVRDVFAVFAGEALMVPKNVFEEGYSLRGLTKDYTEKSPWIELGLDIILGKNTDRKVQPYEYMFLPDHLKTMASNVFVLRDGKKYPLVKSERVLYEASNNNNSTWFSRLSPVFILWILALLVFLLTIYNFKKFQKFLIFDLTLFFVLGLIGLLLVWLKYNSLYYETEVNYNLLWANPLYLIYVFFLISRYRKLSAYIFFFTGLIMLYLIILSQTLDQYFHPAFYPVWFIIMIRSFWLAYHKKIKQYIGKRTPVIDY